LESTETFPCQPRRLDIRLSHWILARMTDCRTRTSDDALSDANRSLPYVDTYPARLVVICVCRWGCNIPNMFYKLTCVVRSTTAGSNVRHTCNVKVFPMSRSAGQRSINPHRIWAPVVRESKSLQVQVQTRFHSNVPMSNVAACGSRPNGLLRVLVSSPTSHRAYSGVRTVNSFPKNPAFLLI